MPFVYTSKKLPGETFNVPDYNSVPDASKKYGWESGVARIITDNHANIVRKNYKSDDEFTSAVRANVAKSITNFVVGSVGKEDHNAKLVAKLMANPETRALVEALLKTESDAADAA